MIYTSIMVRKRPQPRCFVVAGPNGPAIQRLRVTTYRQSRGSIWVISENSKASTTRTQGN